MNEELEIDFAVHEAICSERYAAIEKSFIDGDKRMTRIEYLIYIVIAAVLFGPGFAGELVKKIVGL
tara:strand:+ start:5457 stop:5654 length:198 start_codon:yes stop_codon:yes gene_type:complete